MIVCNSLSRHLGRYMDLTTDFVFGQYILLTPVRQKRSISQWAVTGDITIELTVPSNVYHARSSRVSRNNDSNTFSLVSPFNEVCHCRLLWQVEGDFYFVLIWALLETVEEGSNTQEEASGRLASSQGRGRNCAHSRAGRHKRQARLWNH